MGIKLIERPSYLASDSALTEAVVAHALEELRLADNDAFCLLQPTSPIRNKEHIDKAWSKFLSINGVDALISVVKTDNAVLKRFLIEDSLLKPIANSSYPFMPRQSLPEVFAPNGAIYLCTVSAFRSGGFLGTACIPFEMDAESSIDIDNVKDLMLAQAVLLRERI
jgi:N-acylneuraminate cytidylyltransferase